MNFPKVSAYSHNASHQNPSNLRPQAGGVYHQFTPISSVVLNPHPQYVAQVPTSHVARIHEAHANLVNNTISRSNRPQEPSIRRPSTSNQYTVSHAQGNQPQVALQSQRRFNVLETAADHQSASKHQLNDQILDLTFKLGESQSKEQTLKKKEEQMSRELKNVSDRLESTRLNLRSEENIVNMQAREIEMLRTLNDQLNDKNVALTDKVHNASLDLAEKAQLVQEQSLEITYLRGKQSTLERKNEKLSNQIVELTFKLGEALLKEITQKKEDEKMNRDLEEINKRLESTTLALKTEEHIVRLQAKEIETLKKTNERLNEKIRALNADAGNAFLALNDNSRLVQMQVQEIEDLKDKNGTLQRVKEEYKSKYQNFLHTTEQGTCSMEQIQNSLRNVLISNDLILESLKGIQTDPEEKNELMVGHNETHRLLSEQEQLNARVRELEEQLKENGDTELSYFDFCDDSFQY
ncbi:hypothetical protein CAEBREN_00780 [Caenorhabditis brenneri]|uniref:Uncharacterized protein n=1 Tax=Caenorhabditis brenneri TaxID=135651 RepID=G0NG22_CAEBE|nr:hypothetical protein CAEBREN_00780 [Caenorhabditis brenneri]